MLSHFPITLFYSGIVGGMPPASNNSMHFSGCVITQLSVQVLSASVAGAHVGHWQACSVVLIRIASNPGEDLQNCHKFTPKVAIHMCNGTVPN